MLVKNDSNTTRLENVKHQLKLKGFDVSGNSNLGEILNLIFNGISDNSKDIEKIVNELTFDGRSGQLLDELYNFFGIPRIIKNTKEVSLTFYNNNSKKIIIGSNTLVEINGETYRVTTEQNINPYSTNIIYAVPSGVNLNLIDDYVQIGNTKIRLNNITIDSVEENNKSDYLYKYILISNTVTTLDKESDLEYSARAKGLIQHFSDSNITKIKSYIIGIEDVSDVKIYKEFNRTRIVIIPSDIKYLNKIIEQAIESVDFFSSSMMVIDKPTITQFNISGITKQLSEWFDGSSSFDVNVHLEGIKQYLNELFKDLYLTDSVNISSDQIEFTINKYFSDNDIIFSLNEDKLNIKYSIYSDEDYFSPVITNSLERRQNKDFKTDIVIVGEIN